jgi:hypothetical protein
MDGPVTGEDERTGDGEGGGEEEGVDGREGGGDGRDVVLCFILGETKVTTFLARADGGVMGFKGTGAIGAEGDGKGSDRTGVPQAEERAPPETTAARGADTGEGDEKRRELKLELKPGGGPS